MRAFITALFCFILFSTSQAAADENKTSAAFSKMGHAEKRIFLRNMPKGGDLHNHFDGAVYAENFIRWAIEDEYCIDRKHLALLPPPCNSEKDLVPASEAKSDKNLYFSLINAMSMRDHDKSRSGHDHFFNTFIKFGMFPPARIGDIFAETARRLAAQNTYYAELMISTGMFDAAALGAGLEWNDNFEIMIAKLDRNKMNALVAETRRNLDHAEKRLQHLLKCNLPDADPGCKVKIVYIPEVIRTFPREQVFAQLAFAASLAKVDSRIAAINLVAPEDDPVTLQDYKNQMLMVGFFTNKGRDTNVTLHAGELTLGLVPPEDLRNHIRLAIEDAGAKRIGHGISISYEDNAIGLLKKMAKDKIAVEINLTSNDTILGVKSANHPFHLYRKYNVPITLSTDDEGVSRIDLTHEYQRAASTYNLSYKDIKQLARNALTYSFMKGDSLWNDDKPVSPCAKDELGATPSKPCGEFLNNSEKATGQWALEKQFIDFEAKNWAK